MDKSDRIQFDANNGRLITPLNRTRNIKNSSIYGCSDSTETFLDLDFGAKKKGSGNILEKRRIEETTSM